MRLQSFDGTVSYLQIGETHNYQLKARFSASVAGSARQIDCDDLLALQEQKQYRGSLDISRQDDGSPLITVGIVAHGPESAYGQAKDLVNAIQRELGFTMNIASGRIAA